MGPECFSARLTQWLAGAEQEITLLEGDDAITLRRYPQCFLLSAQLTHQPPPTQTVMETWLRLGGASLAHFQGALSVEPSTGQLWLLQCVWQEANQAAFFNQLESLLNQRDTWRSTAKRLARAPQQFGPTPLRAQFY